MTEHNERRWIKMKCPFCDGTKSYMTAPLVGPVISAKPTIEMDCRRCDDNGDLKRGPDPAVKKEVTRL